MFAVWFSKFVAMTKMDKTWKCLLFNTNYPEIDEKCQKLKIFEVISSKCELLTIFFSSKRKKLREEKISCICATSNFINKKQTYKRFVDFREKNLPYPKKIKTQTCVHKWSTILLKKKRKNLKTDIFVKVSFLKKKEKKCFFVL